MMNQNFQKSVFQKNLFLFTAVLLMSFVIFGCNKDNLDTIEKDENMLVLNKTGAEIELEEINARTRNCAPEDFQCTGDIVETLGLLFGGDSPAYYYGGATGVLDALINCPRHGTELCVRNCPNITKEVVSQVSYSLYVCIDNSNIFPASTQQAIINDMKMQAELEAPMCGNRKMIPIHYDLLFSYTNFVYVVSAMVTYEAPCDYSGLLGN